MISPEYLTISQSVGLKTIGYKNMDIGRFSPLFSLNSHAIRLKYS